MFNNLVDDLVIYLLGSCMPAFDALQLGSTNKTLNRLSQSSRVWEQQIEVGLGISLSQLESQPELQGEFENPSGDRSYLRIYKLLDMLPEDYAENSANSSETYKANVELLLKFVICGAQQVGKSCITKMYCDGEFNPEYLPTIGVEFAVRTLQHKTEPNVRGKFQIWNTAGEERFRSLGKLAFRGALVAIIVFDFTASSFAEVETWAKSARDTSKNITVILVGNEKGVKHEVSNLEIRALCKRINMKYLEVNAKTGANVSRLFNVAASIVSRPLIREKKRRDAMMAETIENDVSNAL